MKKFELLEHTADAGVRVFGESTEELFANAAVALFSLMAPATEAANGLAKTVSLTAQKLDELLIAWLNELIALFYAELFLPAHFSVCLQEDGGTIRLSAELKGAPYVPGRDSVAMEIKAATYHGLRVAKTAGGYVAEVIFDV